MSNFPISGSSERAATALGGSEALPLSVLTSYSWSGCGCASLGKAFTVAVACGVNSGAEESFCGGPEFYAVKCRPGPSPGRTCYGIATPVSGCYRSGQSPFCFAAHWVRGSGGDARPSSSFAEDAASSAVLFAARAISFAAAQCWAPAHGAGQGDARSAGLCPWPLFGLVPHPSFGPADPFGSGRSVAVASQAAGDTAVAPVLVQGSAARAGGVLCTAGGTVGISAGASAPGSGPISVGILTSWPGPPSGRFLP
ncbi:hypothetical protein PAPYR_13042 [Paratrimastix pyriformis]|uniref:Uncharacterized protein n=1 Tax=Paratrimastix pyriformis TaxID=342808 RepID=A0ABQ8U5X2_9EUKA|nr:hypothetical protein PAPYR_13042 [Paratrimastix pyriformis]